MGYKLFGRKKMWDKYIIPEYCYQPNICPTCKRKTFKIQENPKQDILNPFIMRCSFGKCRRKKIFDPILYLVYIKIYQEVLY